MSLGFERVCVREREREKQIIGFINQFLKSSEASTVTIIRLIQYKTGVCDKDSIRVGLFDLHPTFSLM